MKNTLRQIFHSPKFVTGFVLFVVILLTLFIYPLFNPGNPLQMIGLSSFSKPGTYVSVYDSIDTETATMKLPGADERRLTNKLKDEDRVAMKEWLIAIGISEETIDITDTDGLLELWKANYDPTMKPAGMTMATRNYYKRLNAGLEQSLDAEGAIIASKNPETGELEESKVVNTTDYVNTNDVVNRIHLPLVLRFLGSLRL